MVEKNGLQNGEIYVTFKWMLMQTLALIISIVTIGFLIIGSVNSKIDSGLLTKVSSEKFEERLKGLDKADSDICKFFEQYENERITTNQRLGLIEQHLAILVGKPLIKGRDKKSTNE